MQFVIASPRMFLTNRLRQPSDGLAEQDISKTGVRPKYTEVKISEQSSDVLADGLTYKTKVSVLSM